MSKLCFAITYVGIGFHGALAQIPAQVFGGNKAVEYQFFWEKSLDKSEKLSLFNFTFFTIDYNKRGNNNYEIYQIATYNLTKNWGVATGGRFSQGQFTPQVALSYQLETKDLYLNLFPTVQFLNNNQQLGYSIFGLLFYTPKINSTWKMFNQLTFEPLFNSKEHIYSYQQLRVGLDYKNVFQFGFGVNLEQLGVNREVRQNIGFFIRKELH